MTPNLLIALNQKEAGSESDVTASYMDVAIPITRGNTSYIIYIRDNRQTVQSLNSQLFMLIIEALVFGLVISVLLSFLLGQTMLTPIERLTEAARRVAGGDFSRRIEVGSRDEIGVLTATFNHMARQLEETLREVENERNKLGTLFLHMTDGVVAFDREGNVIHANPAADEMMGRPVGVGSGADYDALFGGTAPLHAVLEAGQPGYLEGEIQRGDRSLELLLAPFDRENQAGVLVVIHDITQQRKTEEMRREFVANVSHELRTPLTNIRSYAETLADSPDLSPATEHIFLHVILSESDRMTHIVQDLLTLSRLDSGRSEFSLDEFPFDSAIRDIYHAVLMEAQRHCHTLELALEPDIPRIIGDRERIMQVMMNIVSNAIKYTPDGGHIVISAGRKGERVWMEVADNGIGIPEEDRSRIFERFYRVDKARSRESGGTGLGLSIAKEIIDRHGGTISMADRDTPGLTIRIELNIEGPGHGE
jgi:two-component system sensor histidine kinase VicK